MPLNPKLMFWCVS